MFLTLEALALELYHGLLVLRIASVLANIDAVRPAICFLGHRLVGGARRCGRAVLARSLVLCSILVEFFFVHALEFLEDAPPRLEVALLAVLLMQRQQLQLVLVDVAVVDDVALGVVNRKLAGDELCVFYVELVWLLLGLDLLLCLLLLLVAIRAAANGLRLILARGVRWRLMYAVLLLVQSAVRRVELAFDAPAVGPSHAPVDALLAESVSD